MALSNIFREPRREITEQLVGMVVIAAVLGSDFLFAYGIHDIFPPPTVAQYVVGMIFGLILAFATIMIMVIMHGLGEMICEALEDRGIHLRPKKRY